MNALIPGMLFGVLALVSGPVAGTAADAQSNPQETSDQSPAEIARRGVARQVQIQSSSQKLENEIGAMIDEYDRNGLNGDEIKSLKNLKSILSRLSDTDMEKIVVLLRNASEPAGGKATLAAISGAYAQQKGVLVQLKQILASYAAEQEALELAENAGQLADRQAAILQAGIETAQWSLTGAKPTEGAIEASLQAQEAEQKAIADESKIFQEKIRAFAKKTGNSEVAERFNKGAEDISKIVPSLEAAKDSLAGKKLFEAVASEKTARDQMRQLARTITPPREASELLREASVALDKMISQQKAMLATTRESHPKPINQWLADELKKKTGTALAQLSKKPETAGLLSLPPEEMAQEEPVKKIYDGYTKNVMEPLSGMEDRQGDMANQADLLSQDLDRPAKPAAELLRSAIPPMRDARTALNEKDSTTAAKHEENAVAAMEKAKASLEQQLAAAEKSEALAGDKTGDLKEIQKQTKELKAEQVELAKATSAPMTQEQAAAATQKQAGLQQKAAQLQQQAAADAPAAAATLGAAAANMKQAASAMGDAGQAPQAQAQQQLAAQNLEKAGQQLDQQIEELGTPPSAADAAADAAQAAAAVAQAQAQLDQAMQQMTKTDAPQAAAAPLAAAAQEVGDAAAQATGLPPDANQAMQAAAGDLAAAAGQAAAGQGQKAQASGSKAQAALAHAAAALAQAQAGIAGAPDAPGSPGAPVTADEPGMPGPSSGDGKGSQGDGGNAQAGGRKTGGKGQFLGLPARDRAAIQQAQSEKYPQQYATKVEQYLKNLADESSRH